MEAIFVVDPLSWEREFKSWSPNSVVGSHMKTIVKVTKALAEIEAPGPGKIPRNRTATNYSTGLLEASIRSSEGKWGSGAGLDLEGIVSAGPKEAVFVSNGTVPHVIISRRGKLLKFKHKGTTVYTRKVHHPGSAANPFLMRALDQAIL
jgi:hypothetical protein